MTGEFNTTSPSFGEAQATCGVHEDEFGSEFPGLFLWSSTCPTARCAAIATAASAATIHGHGANRSSAGGLSPSTGAIPACQNGGECWAFQDLGATSYLCSCPHGWWGHSCQWVDHCASVHAEAAAAAGGAATPCHHGGRCVRVAPHGRADSLNGVRHAQLASCVLHCRPSPCVGRLT